MKTLLLRNELPDKKIILIEKKIYYPLININTNKIK